MVWAVSADDISRGARDVMQPRMQLRKRLADAILEWLGWVALVAPAVKADRGVVANAQQKISHVTHEEGVVIGDGTVPGISEPEVLPDHNAMPIAGLVKSLVADLSNPVADHGEVHLAVIAHACVVLTSAIAQHRFREAPVAPATDEAASIDGHRQLATFFAVGHLANAGFESLLVKYRVIRRFE